MTDYTATTADVAEVLNVKPATVRRYATQGVIPCVTTPGGHRRFNLVKVIQAVKPGPEAVSMQPLTPPEAIRESDEHVEVFDVPFTPARRRLVRSVTVAAEPRQRRSVPVYDTAEDLELAATDMTVV